MIRVVRIEGVVRPVRELDRNAESIPVRLADAVLDLDLRLHAVCAEAVVVMLIPDRVLRERLAALVNDELRVVDHAAVCSRHANHR